MRISFVLPLLCGLPLAAQGEIAYYKFDAADADQVVNYASGAGAAPVFAGMSAPSSLRAAMAPGRFGGALRGNFATATTTHSLQTGWTGGHRGSLTIAFHARNRGANTPTVHSPLAGQPGWSLASGGSAGPGLQLSGWGGNDLTFDPGSPLCMLTGWNHFAVVVDAQAGTATWYHNGSAAGSTPISTGVSIATQAEMVVGMDYASQSASLYDLDEVRVLGRAASPQEIAAWAGGTTAGVASFGNAAGANLDPMGQPTLGNPGFALRVTGTASAPFAFLAGGSYSSFAGRTLPFDLSAILPVAPGTELRVAIDAVSLGVLGSGESIVGLGVPGHPSLLGSSVHAQAIVLEPGNDLSSSNALAISPGH